MSDEAFSLPAPTLGCHVGVRLRYGVVHECRFLTEPWPDAVLSPAAARVRDAVERHLARGDADLAAIPVDLSAAPDFQRRVLERLHATRPGATLTYGELAALVGSPGASRAVGVAMARNPIPIIVPCHRVVGADGWPGGYSGLGGLDTKRRLLALETRARTLDAF